MKSILRINHTLELLCSCWNAAEKSLQNGIKERHPDADEVLITNLFHGHFKDSLESVNKENLVVNAFIRDLKAAFPLIDNVSNYSRQISAGLIAEVKLHKPATEKITGGDLGFVIARPNLYLESPFSSQTHLVIQKKYDRGILTQAKLKNEGGKWGRFTSKQEKVLPQYQNFLALLLYSYQDSYRHNLEQFRWQLCADHPFNDLKNWLKLDNFPNTFNSCEIIKKLGSAEIGTDDEQKINDVIRPPENRSLIIDIHWPDDKPPFSKVWIRTKQEEKELARPVTY